VQQSEPVTQTVPAPLQAPQWFLSLARSAQVPLQQAGLVPPQVVQVSPQAFLSVSLFTQVEPQQWPAPPSNWVRQLLSQAPQWRSLSVSVAHPAVPQQAWAGWQIVPHAWQWPGSLARFAQLSPQQARPEPHGAQDPQWRLLSRIETQVPPQHLTSCPEQVLPPSPRQAPQWVSENRVSTQAPLQHWSFGPHGWAVAQDVPHRDSSVSRFTHWLVQHRTPAPAPQ
jgi:hypothetical protein